MQSSIDYAWPYQSAPSQAGRSNARYASSQAVNAGLSSAGSGYRSALSKSYLTEEPRAGTYTPSQRYASSLSSRSTTTPNMSVATPSPASPASAKTMPNLMHSKLHKRGSGSGTNTRPSLSTNISEPFPDIISPVQSNSSTKVKPYLRKLSSAKEDQGRIDLSKPLAENEKLAGLGIQDYTTMPEAAFVPAGRSHARTTSVGSQMSTGSGSRPQPFIHPMRQAPRPYTPQAARSQTSSPQDGDDDNDEFVGEDYRPGYSFRTRRSMSNSSTQVAPTPLSQTITAADLGTLPRLASTSQSNLSIISTSSKPTGSRRNTNRSQETAISPSSRTSFDRPFGPRRSDTEAQSRDDRIQAARRKFQEKEASKDRKAEKEATKRREAEEAKEQRRQQRERGKSDASERARMQRPAIGVRAGSALGLNSPIMAYEEPTTEKQPGTTRTAAKPEKKENFFGRLFGCTGRRK